MKKPLGGAFDFVHAPPERGEQVRGMKSRDAEEVRSDERKMGGGSGKLIPNPHKEWKIEIKFNLTTF